MAPLLSPSPSATDKNAQRMANKEMIKLHISLGKDLPQIEKVFADAGIRVTVQLRESILWETQFPKVKILLSQGLEVSEIEERMRKTGWVWTPNQRGKAWWEYHKDTIIDKYNTLHSVDAVRKYMEDEKSFCMGPRIYYDWLHWWGVSTSAKKLGNGEWAPILSPTGSAGSATTGSVTEPDQQMYDGQDATSTEVPYSPLSDKFMRSDSTFPSAQFDSDVGYVSTDCRHLFTTDSVTRQSPNPFQSSTGHWPTVTPRSPWENSVTARPPAGSDMSGRHDSVIETETCLLLPFEINTSHISRPAGGFSITCSQNSDSYGWTPQNSVLRSIPCDENHQGIDLDYHCCGSSPLQDLAFLTKDYPSEEVHRLLLNYTRDGAQPCDAAGNTFLHKLADFGASWDYFEAAIDAQIDPCHQNAYGQTFAHVLNISALRDNLMECLSLIIERGIDFSQQDASGWTILHCLFSQPIPLQIAEEILRLADIPSGHLYRRDVLGQTPCELYKQSLRRYASIWYNIELELQNLSIFKDTGLVRLGDEDVDWQGGTNDAPEIRAKLQNQYREVIKNAINGIAVEAADGSNAFHAQAGLITAQEVSIDVSYIKKFISVGIDVNGYDDRGRTPLEAIITQSQDYEHELTKSRKVRLLIDKGHASVKSRNRLGHTPLYSAAIRGLDRTVEVLLQCNSHTNIRANDNVSLLKAVQDAFERALAEYKGSQCGRNYYEAQCSRIGACKDLLERYGAVIDPEPIKFMGYAYLNPPL